MFSLFILSSAFLLRKSEKKKNRDMQKYDKSIYDKFRENSIGGK